MLLSVICDFIILLCLFFYVRTTQKGIERIEHEISSIQENSIIEHRDIMVKSKQASMWLIRYDILRTIEMLE